MADIVIQALNVRMLDTQELDELAQEVGELEPGSQVRVYNSGTKAFDPETRDIIMFWISGASVVAPYIGRAVRWVRERRKRTTRLAFYKHDGTILKHILVKDDGSEPEDLTERYQGRSGPLPPRR